MDVILSATAATMRKPSECNRKTLETVRGGDRCHRRNDGEKYGRPSPGWRPAFPPGSPVWPTVTHSDPQPDGPAAEWKELAAGRAVLAREKKGSRPVRRLGSFLRQAIIQAAIRTRRTICLSGLLRRPASGNGCPGRYCRC